jgi:hypothetical protein
MLYALANVAVGLADGARRSGGLCERNGTGRAAKAAINNPEPPATTTQALTPASSIGTITAAASAHTPTPARTARAATSCETRGGSGRTATQYPCGQR